MVKRILTLTMLLFFSSLIITCSNNTGPISRNHTELVNLYHDWRTFQSDVFTDGIPDYSEERMKDQYIAMGSWGFCYWLALDLSMNRLNLIKEFRIPGSGPPLNLESLVLWFAGDSWYIAWAHRGSVKEPSILFWGSIDLFAEVVTIHKEDSIFVNVPWPILDKRHMSDIDLDSGGILWAAATSDPGDDGPYESGIYKIGKFQKQNDKMEFFIADSFPKQFVFQRNKVEAFTIAGNKKVFATDDENLGAAINISINGK